MIGEQTYRDRTEEEKKQWSKSRDTETELKKKSNDRRAKAPMIVEQIYRDRQYNKKINYNRAENLRHNKNKRENNNHIIIRETKTEWME